jgi:hypothetical protein
VEITIPDAVHSYVVVEVVGPGGRPVEGVSCFSARTDASGRCSGGVVRPPGTEVRAAFSFFDGTSGARHWYRTLRTVPDPDGAARRVEMPGEREIRVEVVDRGGDAIEHPEVTVTVYGAGSPPSPAPGVYRVPGGVPGRIAASAPGYVPGATFLGPFDDTAVYRIVLERGAVLTGRGPAGGWLEVDDRRVGVIGEDGRFEVGAPPGRVRLVVRSKRWYLFAIVEVEVDEGVTRDLGTVRAAVRREVAGVVTDGRGKPLGGALVVIRSDVPGQSWHEIATPADGRFSVPIADAGRWTVAAIKEGRAADHLVLPAGPPRGEIRLDCPRGDATLRVRTRVTAGSYAVRLRFPGDVVEYRWPLRREWVEGPFHVTEYAGLAPGPMDALLRVVRPDGRPAGEERTVRLREGAVATETFEAD